MSNPNFYVKCQDVFPYTENYAFVMQAHEHYELCLLLEGAADYCVEGSVYSMLSGDVILTKKAESHFVKTPQEAPCKFIAVGFSEDDISESCRAKIQTFLDVRPLGQFNLFPAAQFKDTQWKYYLEKLYEHQENPDLMGIYLSVLLTELMLAFTSISQPSSHRSDQLFAVIGYINSHLSEAMSVESLCQRFFISRSQLNRLFRKMTGASVWDYVVAKRLMYAKLLLEAGETPAAACQKCGFNDYSPLYRAYKARYGVSPRLHKQKRT